MSLPPLSPASQTYELNNLQRYAVEALDDEVPEIYSYVKDKDVIREIFEKYVFKDVPNENLIQDINAVLKRINKEIVPPNVILENHFKRIHQLFTNPDPRLFTNNSEVPQFRILLVAGFSVLINTITEPKKEEDPLPNKEKEKEKELSPVMPPAPQFNPSNFDSPSKIDLDFAMGLQMQEFRNAIPQPPNAIPQPPPIKAAALQPAQANAEVKRKLTKAEIQDIYYHHINDLVAQLAEIDFAKFLNCVPTISRHLMAIDIKAKIRNGDLDAAIRQFFTLIVAIECWDQFLDALDKFPELEETRKLFGR